MCIISFISAILCNSFCWHTNSFSYLSSIVIFQWHWYLLDCYNSHSALEPSYTIMSHQLAWPWPGQWWSVMVSERISAPIKLQWRFSLLHRAFWLTESFIAPTNAQHMYINPLNAELNPICPLLALLGAHHILHISRIRVKTLNFLH